MLDVLRKLVIVVCAVGVWKEAVRRCYAIYAGAGIWACLGVAVFAGVVLYLMHRRLKLDKGFKILRYAIKAIYLGCALGSMMAILALISNLNVAGNLALYLCTGMISTVILLVTALAYTEIKPE